MPPARDDLDRPHARRRLTGVASGLLGLLLLPGAALAAEPAIGYFIPAGTLAEALTRFATRSDLQLLYSPSLVAGQRSAGLDIRADRRSGLEALLEGHGLIAVQINPNTYVLERGASRPQRPARRPSAVTSPELPLPPQPPSALPRVNVTGTRVPRPSLETTIPITVLTASDIERSGHDTLFELLRTLPGMQGHNAMSVATENGASFQPIGSAATTDLYALGPRATLFLVDGRRMATYGLVPSDLGGISDLSGIPLSFIDRIEILRGGASAVYGADAIAGTVNIMLKKDVPGIDGGIRIGRSGRGDAGGLRVNAGFGFATSGDGFLRVNADHIQQAELGGDRRSWHSHDLRRWGLPDTREPLGATSPLQPLQDGYRCIGDTQDRESAACRFDAPRYASLRPALDGNALHAHWQQPLGAHTDLHVSARHASVHQRQHAPPLSGAITLPAGHPDDALQDPLGAVLGVGMQYAFYEMGAITGHTRSESTDLAVGLQGHSTNDTWSWRIDGYRSTSRVGTDIGRLLLWRTLGERIMEYRFDGSPNPPALTDALSTRIHPRGRDSLDVLSASIEGELAQLPAGTLHAAFGAEIRWQHYRNQPDPLQLSGDLSLAAASVAPVDARDRAAAMFAELDVPVHTDLRMDLAARLEDDRGFGRQLSPRLGLSWTPDTRWMLRASTARGYRTPSVHDLRKPLTYTTANLQTVIESGSPELRPCLDLGFGCLVEYASVDNPRLRPETSRSTNLGLVLAPAPGWDLTLDHYRVDRWNELGIADASLHPELYPEGLERNADGVLVRANRYLANVGRGRASGWELDANHIRAIGRSGQLRLHLGGHYLQHFRITDPDTRSAVELAGHDLPRLTLQANAEWMLGNWTPSVRVRYFSNTRAYPAGTQCLAHWQSADKCTVPSATYLGIGLEYAGAEHWRASFNIENLTDRQPANYREGQAGYNPALDDPWGRYFLLSARWQF